MGGGVEVCREGSAGEGEQRERGERRGVYRGMCGAPDGPARGTVSELRSPLIMIRAQPPGDWYTAGRQTEGTRDDKRDEEQR